MEKKMMKKICSKCGKVIESLYPKQLDYNFNAHRISCEKKSEVDDETRNG
jgi:hypothetical protein